MKKSEVGETESAKVQEAKQAWLKSKGELDTLSKKISALEMKKEQAEKELKGIKVTLASVEAEKSEALALIAIGEIEEAQFAKVKKRHEEAEQRNEYLKELIQAIDHEKGIQQKARGELANETDELRRGLWGTITTKLKAEILKATPDIYRLYIANQLSGGGYLRMGVFLEERVFGRPTDAQHTELWQELIEQYENN